MDDLWLDWHPTRISWSQETLPPLERLLRSAGSAGHEALAAALWESSSVADAVSKTSALATPENLEAWHTSDYGGADEDEGHVKKEKKGGRGRDRSDAEAPAEARS